MIKEEEFKIELIIQKGLHLMPRYYGYKEGTFDRLNKCSECNLIGLYEDLYEGHPCPNCGSKIDRSGAGMWNGDKWEQRRRDEK